MSVMKIILIGGTVLVINNVLLLNFLGYFSDKTKPTRNELNKPQAVVFDTRNAEQDISRSEAQNTVPENDVDKQVSTVSLDQTQIIDMLRNVAETDDFIAILDNYQTEAGRRYMELQKKYGSMNALELYDVVQNAETNRERQFALQVLTQSNFGELETYQIKSILNTADLQSWHKGKLLSNLLERRDPEALGLAKDYMSQNPSGRYMDQNLVRNVYDLDPQYIEAFVNDLDLDKGRDSFAVLSVALEDPKIAKEFYKKNFDQIVESKSSELFNYLNSSSDLDLSVDQQNKIVDLLQSPNRQKRQFAMGMLNNVENLDTIREAFQNMDRESEKRNFIYILVGQADNPERKQLAKKLAESIDDPRLQKFLE